jgi:hypothetical protein
MELFDVLLVGALDALRLGELYIYNDISSASLFPLPSRVLFFSVHVCTRGAAHTTVYLCCVSAAHTTVY